MSCCIHACAGSWQDEDVCHIPGPTGSFASTFLIGLVILSFVDPWSVNCRGATIFLRTAEIARAHLAMHKNDDVHTHKANDYAAAGGIAYLS